MVSVSDRQKADQLESKSRERFNSCNVHSTDIFHQRFQKRHQFYDEKQNYALELISELYTECQSKKLT